jgi:hypothetical protein
MKKKHQKLLATFEKLSLRAQENVMQFVQYLEYHEKEQLRLSQEPRYLAHFEDDEGIFLIEDDNQ